MTMMTTTTTSTDTTTTMSTAMMTPPAAIKEIYAVAYVEGGGGIFNASNVKPLNFFKALKALIIKFSQFTSIYH